MNDLRNIWPEWEVEKELGTGSFGTVYKVVRRDYELESYAAIKVITIPSNESEVESLRSDGYDMKATKTYFQEIVNDFVNEIRLMESLKGMQNIVSVEDYKVVENSDKFGWTIYIRMELLTPFNTYTCDKKLTEAEVIKLGCDICSALEICSKRNIIHRDIKPENIFINDFGYFKLGDFGIARKMENMTSGLSRKGTPNYMAPEVANSSDYDSSVDIYSIGLVLYKLLNGNRLPFLDKKQIFSHGDKMNALNRRLGGEALPVPCDASPAMAKLILRACAYDPSKRFLSATEMKEALMRVSNNYQEEISKDEMEKNELSKIWPEWEIEKELGRGYWGIVYKAVSRKQSVKYAAIKVISIPANVSEVDSLYSEGMDKETVRTCLKEMVSDIVSELKLMESINDTQNLVRIEDYKIIEKSDGLGWSIYIRMELLTPFNVYTSETKLTETEVIKLGSDICTALEVYSKHNIVYGDVKPDNIFIDDLGSYKLDMYRGEHGYVLRGASYYTAPEVVKGTSYDLSADTYSLGLVLYRLLNGNRFPFLDKKQVFSHGDKMNALNRRLGGEALPVPCDASPAMAKLILRACAYDPSMRFSSATEMKEALMSIGNNSVRKAANDEIEAEMEKRAIGGEILDGSNIVRISADAIERCKNKRNKRRKLWDETDSLNAQKPILYLNKDVVAKEEFSGREDFNILVLGENVKSLEDKAFCGCVNLEYIYIVGEHIRIGSSAFSGCSKLKYVIYEHVPTDEQQYENKLFRKKMDYFANDAFTGCGELKMYSDDKITYLNNYCKKNNFRYYSSIRDSELNEEFYGLCGLIHESGLNWGRKKKANVYVVKEEPGNQMKNNVHKDIVSNANTILTEPEKVFQEYYVAARDGDSEAQFNLAECFANGTGTERDIDEALKWYSSAANQGNDDATVKLYSLCLEKNEEEKALSILQVAAENGNWKAMLYLAKMYEEGFLVKENDEKSKYWYEEGKKAQKESQQNRMQKLRENQNKRLLDSIEQQTLRLQERMERYGIRDEVWK